MNKNNLFQKGFILPVLIVIIALLVIGGGVYIYKNKKVEAPVVVNENEEVGLDNQQEIAPIDATVKNTNTKSFKLGTLEFSYPNNLIINNVDNFVSLSHFIAYKHENSCDFEGDAPTLNEIYDFDVSFKIVNSNLIGTLKVDVPYVIKGSTVVLQPGFVDKYAIGSLEGYKIYRGLEACGTNVYYLSISSNQTLVIYRNFYAQTLGQISDNEKVKKVPELLTRAQEESIFQSILSSVTGIENQKTMTVKLYFPNRIFNPESFDCSLVYPVDRTIPYTQAVATATLNELIKGPTAEEEKNGYFSSIPDGTKANSVKIVDGVLFVDFNEVATGGGGSCGQMAKGSSMSKTLMQFPTVKSIQMTINGKGETADLFQP